MATAYAPAAARAPVRWRPGELERVRARLVRPLPADGLWGWVGPLAVTAFAALLRFSRLSVPRAPVFDEVYYAHDSYSLLRHGVELSSHDKGPGFVVHPPLGKWMIALGEWLFNHHSTVIQGGVYPASRFSWRFSAALFGTLTVLLLARTARRMFGSALLGSLAGLLLCFDGLEFVQSRVSMLDVFVLFWVVAAFGCLVVDRDDGRARLAARLGGSGPRGLGPFLGVRWWRLAAGVCLGGACATKWSGVYLVPAFLLLAYAWDAGARRTAGTRHPWVGALLVDTSYALVAFVVVPLVVYVASWTGWFLGDASSWDHDRYVHAHSGWLRHARDVLGGWLRYHWEIYNFHAHLTSGHPYRSNPLGWLVLARPVAYFYASPHGCGSSACADEILGIGTPAIWWASVPALVWTGWRWVSRRDWRAAAILVVFAANYLPWFYEAHHHRTMFLFYALPALPFMVLALTYCAGLVLGPPDPTPTRRAVGSTVVGTWLIAGVALNFFFLYPVLAARDIPYHSWQQRMWFQQCTNGNDRHETAPCWI